MLAIKGAPADDDTHTCCPGPTLRYVSICQFYSWLYQTQRLFIICTIVTDVTKHSLRELLSGSQKKENFLS